MSAYRGELTGARRWLVWFTIPSIAGGAFGAWLLLHTSAHRFGAIVPFFMLGATVLFVGQRPLTRWLSPGRVESGSTGQLDTAWRARCGMALAPGLRFHDLRHTVITMLAEMGLRTALDAAKSSRLVSRLARQFCLS